MIIWRARVSLGEVLLSFRPQKKGNASSTSSLWGILILKNEMEENPGKNSHNKKNNTPERGFSDGAGSYRASSDW
jgi:hypothetical protein